MRDKKLIQMYITSMCNSHCKTCGIWKNKERKELCTYDINKVFLAFPHANYVIGGGEAILHKSIEKVLFLLKYQKINYTLLSNCINIDKLCMLVKKYSVPAVTVSCDGVNHDSIRGVKGNLANISLFKDFCKDNNVKFKISYTYSKYNEKTFIEDMDMFKTFFGQKEIYFCIAQDMDLLMTAETDESFVAKDFSQILDCDLILEKDKRHIKSMTTGIRRCCTSQNNVHTIYSNGDIVRCQSFKSKEVLGNLDKLSIQEINWLLSSVKNERCQFDVECDLLCQRRYD